nr:relaxase/mobilization nuclease domain-containing protein [Nitrosomonas nitrosa]
MILKGSQRDSAAQLARHLLRADENEHVEIHELKNFVADDLHGALQEIYAVSRGTRCQQYMFSVSLNPPQEESAPIEYFEKAITDIEAKLGLKNQPRAIVFHEKEGRRHCHVVWSRIDAEEMKAINLPYYKMKLQDVSRQLYFHYGWEMPKGLLNKQERNPLNFTLAQWQQAKRAGEDPKLLQKLFQECWAASDNKASFEQALNGKGLYLAKGDRRGFVAIDYKGEVYSISRWLKVKTKALTERLGDPDKLPTVTEVNAQIAQRMTQKLKTYVHDVETQLKRQVQPYVQKTHTMREQHRAERSRLQRKQEERWQEESIARSQRLPKGFKGIWFRITGKHKNVRQRNEQETERCAIRDRDERQELTQRQLVERRKLQEEIRPIVQERKLQLLSLKQDIARYMELGTEPPNPSREDTRQRRKDRDFDYTPEL